MEKEHAFFIENLSTLISSEIGLREAIASVLDETKSRKMRKSLEQVLASIEGGSTLSDALVGAGILSSRFISLLKIGEATGGLPETLRLIVLDMRKEKTLRSKIRNALVYPGFIMATAVAVGVLALWFTFPKLISLFDNFDAELPWTTRVIIALGTFIKNYGGIVIPGFFLLMVGLICILFINKKTKHTGESLLLALPISRTIMSEVEISRMGYMLGTLLKAGVTLPEAMKTIEEGSSFMLYKRLYTFAGERIIEGNSIHKSLSQYPHINRYFPSTALQMISSAERSGRLAETFLHIGELYEEKTDNLTRNLSSILEPVILLFVGLVVGFIALGIISPIYNLVGNLGA